MGIVLLIGIVLISLLVYSSKTKKYWLKFFVVNAIVIAIYNIALWTYIFKYLDAGGASLGPGLLLMGFTGLHLVIVIFYAFIRSFYQSKTSPARNHIEILDEVLNILQLSGKTKEYEQLKTELSHCFIGNEYAALGASTLLYYQKHDQEINKLIAKQLEELIVYCNYNLIYPQIRPNIDFSES